MRTSGVGLYCTGAVPFCGTVVWSDYCSWSAGAGYDGLFVELDLS